MSLAIPNPGTAAVARRIERVVETLSREPGLTSQDLAERLDLTRRHASLLLLRLEETGLVVHEGRRWFPSSSTL
jgi:DNA-binding IclR family transcriptional regulator